MKARIGKDLVAKLIPQTKPYEVYDSEMKGFTLRVQPSGAMTYLVRYRLRDGKQTRAVIGKHPVFTPVQARDRAKDLLADITKGKDPAEGKRIVKCHTFRTFIDEEYSPWAKAHRKDGKATVARLNTCFAEFLDLKLVDISAWLVEKWRTGRLETAKPTTVNRDLTAFRALLSKAVEWGRIDIHPLSKVKPLKVDNSGKVRFLTDDEESRLLTTLDDREEKVRTERDSANKWRKERDYPLFPDLRKNPFTDHLKPMVILSLNTGLRWGELTQMRWDNIDLKKAIVTVAGDTTKSSKTRHIPLNKIAVETLKSWKKQSSRVLLFPGVEGKPINNVKKSWQAVLLTAGINKFRWHDLRHHFASRLVMAGVDLNTVRELLGHSDLKMTLRYAHLAPEHKASAVAKLVR